MSQKQCWFLDDGIEGLHAGFDVVVHMTVQQPLPAHGGVHGDVTEDTRIKLHHVPVVYAALVHVNLVAMEMDVVNVQFGSQVHELPIN